MFVYLLLPLFMGSPAVAGDSSDAATLASSESARTAEYKRLREEFQRLVKRNAWAGAERTFQSMLQTGVEPHYGDLKVAAQVAQASGDISLAQERLKQAHFQQQEADNSFEDKEVIEALFAIDSSYGPVFLAGNPGEASLSVKVMPFDPTQARAVEHAIETVKRTGMYEGLLPKGDYEFSGHDIKVRPRVTKVQVDLRTEQGVRKSRRAQRRAERED